MAYLELRDLTFSYPNTGENALSGVSLTVEKGAFAVLCGPSGGGKTTLLRLCRPAIAPHGKRTGDTLLDGQPVEALGSRAEAMRIGFVGQLPDEQIVTDKVWHELAFGLESLGLDTMTIRRRVAEMSSFFGIEEWFHRSTDELSGGQKQILCLASVMAMQPEVLLLDEPTAQLDPIAASEFLSTLGRLNRELGVTVVLSEHRLEESFALASQVAVLDGGKLVCVGTPQQVGLSLRDTGLFPAMPAATRIWAAVRGELPCPVTVRDGRNWLETYAAKEPLGNLPAVPQRRFENAALSVQGAYFRYEKDAPDVLSDVSLTAGRGELLAILGGNGAGKTTLLRLLHGARKPQRGTVEACGKTALLPQDPRTLFVKKTVREELSSSDVPYDDVVRRCRLASLLDRHPFDLSGGESQRAALAKALLASPDILLLDEPTKGVDAAYKQELGVLLRDLCEDGVTVVMVSHDVEFCASFADRCALLFDGAVAAEGAPRAFFSGNGFYTTAANRMARELLPEAVTAEDVICACGGEIHQTEPPAEQEIPPAPETQKARLPWWRIALAAVSGCAAVWMLAAFLTSGSLNELLASDGLTQFSWAGLWRYGVLFASLIVLFAAVGRPASRVVRPQRTVPKRTVAAAAVIVLLIPLTIWLGESVLGGRKYYFISLLLLLEILLPFFLVFEGRKPKARELTVIAVLCALGVASRAVFFMLPQFKPVMAIAILAGVAFGGETGFLVGAVTMLVSNLMFSQGPWTPWQMVAMGLAGFLAGVIFRRGASRLTLSVFGALAAIFVYGLIMNTAAAVIWAHTLDRGILLTYYVTGLPVDCVHAAATWLFLWLLTDPMLEKLERIKIKYGLLDKEGGAS